MEEEIMMTTKMMKSPVIPRIKYTSGEPITTSTCPTWKLYENPFYNHHHPQQEHDQEKQGQEQEGDPKQLHHLHLPVSARKIAASFWDLTFIRPIMEAELDVAKAQITELKAKLGHERKARKKMESVNKRLAGELLEEKMGREALERVCADLAREISENKQVVNKMKKEMEEERKRLKMAEVFREERLQMQLAEAKFLLEEKMLELEVTKQKPVESSSLSTFKTKSKNQENIEQTIVIPLSTVHSFSAEQLRSNVIDASRLANSLSIQRRDSPEPENPHIKRGIKGFVEFPKVVRAIGSRSRHLGTKLECQKAQLRILLKQKCPMPSNNLIMS